MIKIPFTQEKRWQQTNTSDLFGTLFMSRNMNYDKQGYATLAKRSRALYSSSLAENFGRVGVIAYYDSTSEYFIFTNDRPYKLSFASDAVTITDENATTNMPSMDLLCRNDLINWQSYLYATSTTSLRRYNSGGWSLGLTGSGFTGVTDAGQLAVFKNFNYLCVAQGNTVLLLDTSHNLVRTLTLQSEFKVTSMDWNNNLLFIGTRNINNDDAMLFVWDGTTTAANGGYSVGTHRINSVRAYQSSCALVTSKGKLLYFTGNGFKELAGLPISFTSEQWDVSGSTVQGRVISRGMAVDGDKIYIHVSPSIFLNTNASNSPQLFDWFPGGIWCYDPAVGLYQKYSNSSSLRTQTGDIATTSVDTATDIITTTSVPITGTPVIYDNGAGASIGGLTHREKYYVIYVSNTTLKLATTWQNAMDGVAIDLTSTGNDAQFLVYLPNRDFGGNSKELSSSIVGSASAILLLKPQSSVIPHKSDAFDMLFGARIGGTVINGEYVLDAITTKQENRGFIVTQKLQAFSIKDTWQNIGIKFNGVKTVEDKIVVKYRVAERNDLMNTVDKDNSQTATWVNNQKFTTTGDLSLAKVGDEVYFHAGAGAGYLAHITAISESGGTYTVDIDEIIQNVTDDNTATFTISNWIKLGIITTDDLDYFTDDNNNRQSSIGGLKEFNINKNSKWLQLKIEFRGEDVAIEEIYVNNKSFTKYTTYQ